MAEEQKAALTPDEWTEWAEKGEFIRHLRYFAAVFDSGDDRGAVILDGALRGQDAHAGAALCLYQQPFGFTHEDIGLLRRMWADTESPISFEESDAGSLASRISALLPPTP